MKKRFRILVKGIVQGVGFRPFVYQLAHRHNLPGWVLNSSEGVIIEVDGEPTQLKAFADDIRLKAPPRARIEKVAFEELEAAGFAGFEIKESLPEEGKFLPISPDIATCDECLKELFNPKDRRYRYPFINCTNCGPRFTIIEDIPYDRPLTTMKKFTMCPDCQREYNDPMSRRFHAQPNACSSCGPALTLVDSKTKGQGSGGKGQGIANEVDQPPVASHQSLVFEDAIKETIDLLKQGKVIAIKGLGGFHLACDAENNAAVELLRNRKRRFGKPLAIMVADIEKVRQYCEVSQAEEKVLLSPERPIVLLKKKPSITISEEVAPNNNYLGVMLPYTPLHHLLLRESAMALVMTSGNISEEPIAMENEEAFRRLGHIADYFLLHNRDIYSRYDDSVTRVIDDGMIMIRRARSFAPYPIHLPFKAKQILAVGPELKNTFCLTKENYAFVSQHIGDMENLETMEHFLATLELYKRLFRVEPEIVAYDFHPEYLSTKFALEQEGVELIGVQHHHAHITSVMVENNVSNKVIGVSFDGTGYGTDGHIWGGEFLVCDWKEFERVAHFEYVPMPGGAAAIEKPYRMAFGYLYHLLGREALDLKLDLWQRVKQSEVELMAQQIDKKINTPLTSSCGRLFDAVSSLLGIRDVVQFEAQAAIEMEMIADENIEECYHCEIMKNSVRVIGVKPVFDGIVKDLTQGISRAEIAGKFHNTIVAAILCICGEIREETGLSIVALSGGVFQNALLFKKVKRSLIEAGFKVIYHQQVPTNDGCISLGQAVIANNVTSRL